MILSRCRSSEEKSGPAGAGAAGAVGGASARRIGAAASGRGGGLVEFVLARGDFGDREIERGRAERRRGAIDLGCGALDHFGLALLVLHLGLPGRRGVGNLRQPRIEARDRVVELAGHASARRGRASPRGASLRGAGREICSICRVIESSRW